MAVLPALNSLYFITTKVLPILILKMMYNVLIQNAKAHQQLLEQQVFSLVAYFNSLQDQNIRQGDSLFAFKVLHSKNVEKCSAFLRKMPSSTETFFKKSNES